MKRGNFERKLKKYGLTPLQYEDLAKKGCAICGGGPNGRGRFHLDHDHTTGLFRGLLCHSCNVGIGSLKENLVTLENAIQYIQSFKS